MKPGRLCSSQPRGTATLEMIIVLPSLLLLVFGGLELSRMWMTMNLVTQAAREGARVAVITNPFNPSSAITRIRDVLAGANLTSSTASVTCAAPCTSDSVVTATVSVNYQTLFPALLPMLAGPFSLTSSAVMRYE
jgi:Flp pilus assembly protein TadG